VRCLILILWLAFWLWVIQPDKPKGGGGGKLWS